MDSMDIDIPDATYGNMTNGLQLRLVSPGESGEGLPYAPENWPCRGDIWRWKTGKRVTTTGHFMDRYLYPPKRLLSAKGVTSLKIDLKSKRAVERYIRTAFPKANLEEFFNSFSWRIPGKYKPSRDGNGPEHVLLPSLIGDSDEDPETLSDSAACKAGNRNCPSLVASEENFSLATMPCDICCTEPNFCTECCCILCCKAVKQEHGGYNHIKCEAVVDEGYICGHIAHVNCALRAYLAGTVGGSIGLDAEYYCRRCDAKTDLIPVVRRFPKLCETLDSHDDVVRVLNLGICMLRGSQKDSCKELLNSIESAIIKVKCGTYLEDIGNIEESVSWKRDIGHLITEEEKTLAKERVDAILTIPAEERHYKKILTEERLAASYLWEHATPLAIAEEEFRRRRGARADMDLKDPDKAIAALKAKLAKKAKRVKQSASKGSPAAKSKKRSHDREAGSSGATPAAKKKKEAAATPAPTIKEKQPTTSAKEAQRTSAPISYGPGDTLQLRDDDIDFSSFPEVPANWQFPAVSPKSLFASLHQSFPVPADMSKPAAEVGLNDLVGMLLKGSAIATANQKTLEAERATNAELTKKVESFRRSLSSREDDLKKVRVALEKALKESSSSKAIASKYKEERDNLRADVEALMLERNKLKESLDSTEKALLASHEKAQKLKDAALTIGLTAVMRERATLMRQFLNGESGSWAPEEDICLWEQHERREQGLPSEEDEEEQEQEEEVEAEEVEKETADAEENAGGNDEAVAEAGNLPEVAQDIASGSNPEEMTIIPFIDPEVSATPAAEDHGDPAETETEHVEVVEL